MHERCINGDGVQLHGLGIVTRGIEPMWKRRILVSLVVLTVLVSMGGYGIWRSVRPPEIPAFYDPPALPAGAVPGQILRTEEIESPGGDDRVWRMLYTSTDASGMVVPVSALVAAPTAAEPDGGYPLLAVGHGTVGIARGCAPSIAPFQKADATHTVYDFFVGDFVEAGYAVVMADYAGLGVPGDNAYLVGEIEGRTILDAARAIRTFPAFAVRPGILITGQSQGGHAALFAAQLAPTYAPELSVLGVAALAPAADLEAIFREVTKADDRGGVVALPVMAADAYARAYPDIGLDRVLTKRGRSALDGVIEELCLFPAILGTQLARASDLIQPDGLAVLGPYVALNTPGGGPFATPIFLGQGDADVVVPSTTNARFAERLCRVGNDVTFRVYDGVGHFAVVDAAMADVLAWMQEVRDGASPSTCA